MGTFLLLMAQASAVGGELAASEGSHGFGINTNILDTNLINLAIIITVLLVFGRKVLGTTLQERREKIETAIKSAEQRLKDAQGALADQQQKLAQAQAEAEKIKQAGEQNAVKAREALLAQAAADIERMKETATADLNSERDKAIAQLRQRVVALALQKVEAELQTGIADDAQHTLVDRSIALLG
ncbi:F0F1 ATP synthase subunit B [Aetokthonos hydrillicola Thurmond2011]|jgi:F-type H+-transporting ATPase subunit b|uniref:ATP synthase subunit b n=1 Tax=Aetokthonos hydrillicola Thurmond2011 TaxID=2712845 RepID=A0AAP5IG97_9CYAN|nr:F0F1 ATP synthase subunit B [Aetokthonos hydrillicola]MBO3460991.1 F0F1 ATP synthase subunit B [Aetokthonos hydrillicola CCALA 1050]MBW4588440.1 F0F1 ATP synthase subunit B [Aetokthonos hydrillicola CCALA 1050]MDR9900809.1 F0F1 ATP synthase subunit B [Aetokthonos hydrillicola Thurmond2011]